MACSLLAVAVVAGCAGGDGPVPPGLAAPAVVADVEPTPDPASGRVAALADPHERTLTIEIGELADGTEVAVVVRETVVGDRRHVALETPAGVVDQHIVTDDEHWWWLAPAVRAAAVDAEWIHLDVDEIERAGAVLPDVVTDARRPLPAPEDLQVGDRVAGYAVRSVEHLGPDEARAQVDGVAGPVVIRRRVLPADTTVEIPLGATSWRDVPGLLSP